MNNLGQPMEIEFKKLYEQRKSDDYIFSESFRSETFNFFTQHANNYELHNLYFAKFGCFWLRQGLNEIGVRPDIGERLLNQALEITEIWELSNKKRIHKGTPYYFLGVIAIVIGDIDKGLLLMHQAYKEDELTGDTNTPAYFFISLDNTCQEQFFRVKVTEVANFLANFLRAYCKRDNLEFNLDALRTKLLAHKKFMNEAYYFVYCLFKIKKIIDIPQDMRANRVGSFIQTALIFDLCKLAEVLLRSAIDELSIRKQFNYNANNRIDFIHYIDYLCREGKGLTLNQNILGDLNKRRDKNLQATLEELLSSGNSRKSFSRAFAPIDHDLALTYCMRNYGGHKIEDQEVIYNNFEGIVASTLNAIFYILDNKY